MSYSQTITKKFKRPQDMTVEELRQAAEDEGLKFYKDQLAANPDSQTAREELERYAAQRGINLNPESTRMYGMSIEELGAEWTKKGQAQEAAELEKFREKQASIWMASQPRYIPSQASAQKIITFIDQKGLRGTVADLQFAFDALSESGEIEAPPVPVNLYTREELSQMSPEECRAALQQMGFNDLTITR